jgi:hypothetical protein
MFPARKPGSVAPAGLRIFHILVEFYFLQRVGCGAAMTAMTITADTAMALMLRHNPPRPELTNSV